MVVGLQADWSYEELEDAELAERVAGGDERAREEVRRRFWPLAVWYARRLCSRVAHRGRPCPGWDCELAFSVVLCELLDRFAGHPAGGRHQRARKAMVVTWLGQRHRPDTFALYVAGVHKGGGLVTDARRSWNAARGLPVRLHLPRALRRDGPGHYRELLLHAEPAAQAARRLSLSHPEAVFAILQALFDDACETGGANPLDAARLARRLVPGHAERPDVEHAVTMLAGAVDALAAEHWPAWYDDYLSRPRQHTRTFLPLASVGER